MEREFSLRSSSSAMDRCGFFPVVHQVVGNISSGNGNSSEEVGSLPATLGALKEVPAESGSESSIAHVPIRHSSSLSSFTSCFNRSSISLSCPILPTLDDSVSQIDSVDQICSDDLLASIRSKLSLIRPEYLCDLREIIVGMEMLALSGSQNVLPIKTDIVSDISLRIIRIRDTMDLDEFGGRIARLEIFRSERKREYNPEDYSNRRCSIIMRCCCFLLKSRFAHIECAREVVYFFFSNIICDWCTYAPCNWLNENGFSFSGFVSAISRCFRS